MSVVDRERNASQAGTGGGTTTLADRDFVFDVNAERHDFAVLGFQDFAIGRKDEVIVHAAADVGVAAFGGDEKVGSALGVETEIEIHGQGGAIEGRAQVGRRRRQALGEWNGLRIWDATAF